MKPDISKLRQPTRDDLVHAISHAMLYTKGTKRAHDWESINARVAAERLIDGLASANYVIMQGPPALGAAPTQGAQARENDETK